MTTPGWYPDPQVPGGHRWFDGTAWTEHREAPPAPVGFPQPGYIPPAQAGSQPGHDPYLQTGGPQAGYQQPGYQQFGYQQPAPAKGGGATRALVIVGLVIGGIVLLGILAAIAIPVFLNQRNQAEMAAYDALTCTEVIAEAIRLSEADTLSGGIPLSSMTDVAIAEDARPLTARPPTGGDTYLMSCDGQGLWADGLETYVVIDVYVGDEFEMLIELSWG